MTSLSWCFSTMGCAEFSLQQALNLAEQFGWMQIEVRALNDRIDLPAVFDEDPLLLDVLRSSPVQIVALDGSLKLASNTPEDREELLRLARWASFLNVPRVRVFDGGAYAETIDAETEASILETLAWWQQQKAARGLSCELMIETHWAFCNTAFAARVMEETPPGPGILWDTFHPWQMAGESLGQTWGRLGPWVVHVHFKDGLRSPEAPRSVGQGEFPLRYLFELLRENYFEGSVSLEWERLWHPELGPLKSELQRGAEMGFGAIPGCCVEL